MHKMVTRKKRQKIKLNKIHKNFKDPVIFKNHFSILEVITIIQPYFTYA